MLQRCGCTFSESSQQFFLANVPYRWKMSKCIVTKLEPIFTGKHSSRKKNTHLLVNIGSYSAGGILYFFFGCVDDVCILPHRETTALFCCGCIASLRCLACSWRRETSSQYSLSRCFLASRSFFLL